jgi:hypothetical protein
MSYTSIGYSPEVYNDALYKAALPIKKKTERYYKKKQQAKTKTQTATSANSS